MCIFPAPSLSEYPAVLVLVLVVRLTGSPVGVEHVISVTPGVLPLLCDVIETNPDSTGSVWQTRTTAINNGKNSIQVKVTSQLWSNLSSYKFCYKVRWPSKKMKSPGRVFRCTDFRSQEPKYCVLHCFEHYSFYKSLYGGHIRPCTFYSSARKPQNKDQFSCSWLKHFTEAFKTPAKTVLHRA